MSYKEEVEHVLEAAPLVVGVGAAELSGWKAKCPGLFVDIFRDRRGFFEVDQSSVDRVDQVEYRYRIAL